jgi:hypothetical protein
MRITHPHLHPRPALLAALAALALALAAIMPATLQDLDFGGGPADRGAPAPPAVSAPARSEPVWRENPFAWPLLQVPGRSPAGGR